MVVRGGVTWTKDSALRMLFFALGVGFWFMVDDLIPESDRDFWRELVTYLAAGLIGYHLGRVAERRRARTRLT